MKRHAFIALLLVFAASTLLAATAGSVRGKILGLLQAPATKIAGILQAPAGQLARVVGAYAKKEAA